ncbi:hypothetical protein N9980_00755 [bacterium]|nr:hypothetical protein [bacterium]
MDIDYNRVVRAFDGKLVSLTPRRAKRTGEPSSGMVLKLRTEDGDVITLDDNVSKVIDDLAEQVEE